jgi:hypothetical protein
MLRVSSFLCPKQVAPGSTFPVSLDAEYAVEGLPNNATIRGAIYAGNISSNSPLWQSNPTSVSNGGDEVWNITLTAPTSEGVFNLTAYALYFNNGTWTYFDNTVNGPGFSQATIKIGKTATLEIGVGASGIGISVNGTTQQTSSAGVSDFDVAVNSSPLISVPPLIELQNSTRLVFTQWSDGVMQPQRHVLINGDVRVTALYKVQYLLTLNSGSTSEEWYDKGANATITAPTSTAMPWPLSMLGMTQTFQGWGGDIHSPSSKVNVTMDSPKTISADFSTDYPPLAVVVIFVLGLAMAFVSFVLIRRRQSNIEQTSVQPPAEAPIPEPLPEPLPDSNPTCPTCGQETEPDWVHCIKCGTKLSISDPSTYRAQA